MAGTISLAARREVTAAVAERYWAAGRHDKGRILDELCATAERHRKHAVARGARHVDPARLIFVDQTGASTKMTRAHGRSQRGERCVAAVPHGHWKTITFVGGLTLSGMIAPMLIDGAMDGAAFIAWVREMLAPLVETRQIV